MSQIVYTCGQLYIIWGGDGMELKQTLFFTLRFDRIYRKSNRLSPLCPLYAMSTNATKLIQTLSLYCADTL